MRRAMPFCCSAASGVTWPKSLVFRKPLTEASRAFPRRFSAPSECAYSSVASIFSRSFGEVK